MKIYVASSWRNPHQPGVVSAFREDGHEVYDFRNPGPSEHGFSWREIGTGWQEWTAEEYIAALEHPISEHGFSLDFDAMKWCDVCVMVLPCGASAHTEAGWCKGQGKRTAALLLDRIIEEHVVTGLPCFPNGELTGAPRESLPPFLAEVWERRGRPAFQDATNPYREVMRESIASRSRGWEPELMYRMHDLITPSLDAVCKWLAALPQVVALRVPG